MSERSDQTSIKPAWFAGALEIGSIASIGVSLNRSIPYVEIHTTSKPMLEKLNAEYGGENKPRYWRKSGQVAAEIIADIRPFAVARLEHALAMQNWLNAETMAEKVAIACNLQALEPWQQRGNEKAYKDLLADRAFVAGVLDSRCYVALRANNLLYTQTTSKNTALLNALQSRFGGQIRITEPAGKTIDHGNVAFETLQDAYAWETLGSESIDIIRFAFPFLQTPPPEGWDYQKGVERRKQTVRLAYKIAAEKRIDNMKLGEARTYGKLGEMFGIHRKTASRYVKNALS